LQLVILKDLLAYPAPLAVVSELQSQIGRARGDGPRYCRHELKPIFTVPSIAPAPIGEQVAIFVILIRFRRLREVLVPVILSCGIRSVVPCTCQDRQDVDFLPDGAIAIVGSYLNA